MVKLLAAPLDLTRIWARVKLPDQLASRDICFQQQPTLPVVSKFEIDHGNKYGRIQPGSW